VYWNKFTYPSREPGEAVKIGEIMIYNGIFSFLNENIIQNNHYIAAFEIDRLFENKLYCIYIS